MKLGRRSLLLAGAAFPASAYAQCVTDTPAVDACLGGVRSIVPPPPPSLDMSFLSATLDPSITWTRANNNATDGLFTDAAAAPYNTFLANIPRINTTNGLLVENFISNQLLNSNTPATQTTASLAIGTFTLWVSGTGSASPTAGTAIGTGFGGVARALTPTSFTITTAGTVTVAVTGSLTRFQLEAGFIPSSYIPTTSATVLRQVDSGVLPTAAWFNPAEGTYVVDFMMPALVAGSSYDLPTLSTDTNNTYSLRMANGVVQVLAFVANVSTGLFPLVGAVSPGLVQRVAHTYQVGTNILFGCLNGGPVASGGASSLPAINQIKFGVVRLGAQNGFTRRIRYWRSALNAEDLQAVTA